MGWKGEHDDLWKGLGRLLGHTKNEDITQGATSVKDMEGTNAADALAVAAAMAHSLPQQLVDEAHMFDLPWSIAKRTTSCRMKTCEPMLLLLFVTAVIKEEANNVSL